MAKSSIGLSGKFLLSTVIMGFNLILYLEEFSIFNFQIMGFLCFFLLKYLVRITLYFAYLLHVFSQIITFFIYKNLCYFIYLYLFLKKIVIFTRE